MNPANVITTGISLYEENNIAKIIVNKYRLVNINVTEDDLSEGNLDSYLEKIKMVLRIQKIESSPISVEKIWFIVSVAKFDADN